MARNKSGQPTNTTSTTNTNTTNTSTTEGGRKTEGIILDKAGESPLVEKPTPERTVRKQRQSKKQSVVGVEEISALIDGVFTVASLRLGQHWLLADGESETIAKPLSKILDKLNLLEKVANVSDGMALVMATTMVVAPRVIFTIELEKNKKSETATKQLVNKVEVKTNAGITTNTVVTQTENRVDNSTLSANDKRPKSTAGLDGESIFTEIDE